jgi:hypothetical protein
MVQFPRDAARAQGAQVSDSATGNPRAALAERADALCRRLVDIEHAVAVEEWWLLGRALPEARLLAEVSSLLAVARGELENVLAQHFGRSSARSDATDQFNSLAAPSPEQTSDPVWLAGQREKAIHLLRLVASSLPPMMQYAQMLRAHAERLGFASGAVDSLGIVADRLNEAYEALRQPPR